MRQPQMHHDAYFSPFKDHKRRQLHWVRDAAAFSQIQAAMPGYALGDPIFNFKADEGAGITQVDTAFLHPSDQIVLVTRPPLDENPKEKKPTYASRTSLENQICHELRRYFAICSRSRVRLSDAVARRFPPEFEDRADIKFNTHVGGFCSGYAALNDPDHKEVKLPAETAAAGTRVEGITVAYFVRLRRLYPGGPGLLVAFGMGGNETLIWTYLLRKNFRHVLTQSEFFMAEIEEQHFPDSPPSLSFADDWKVTALLNIVRTDARLRVSPRTPSAANS